jgi:hypothetical protein
VVVVIAGMVDKKLELRLVGDGHVDESCCNFDDCYAGDSIANPPRK